MNKSYIDGAQDQWDEMNINERINWLKHVLPNHPRIEVCSTCFDIFGDMSYAVSMAIVQDYACRLTMKQKLFLDGLD